MTDANNALAELAERLKNGIYSNPKDRFACPVVCESLDANDVLMAQRIVAELAKVDVCKNDFSSDERDCILDLANAAIKCRAIAEEGASNERK